jgi:glycosyltransferase involved in cell wall biosynthesis
MTIALVIPTRNRGALLMEAVNSVLALATENDEVIVVDDSSTDGSIDDVRSLGKSVRVIQGAYGSAGAARNAGAAAASEHAFLAFLDSDDQMLPGKTRGLLATLEENPDAAIAHGLTEVIDASGRGLPDETSDQHAAFAHGACVGTDYPGLAEYCAMFTSATLMRREAFDSVGGYDTSLLAYEDWDLYLRLSRDWRILYSDAPAARYRIWQGNVPWPKTAAWTIHVAERHLASLPELDADDERRARYGFLRRLATSHHVLSHRTEARAAALSALRLDPARAIRDRSVRGPLWRSLAPAALLRARRPPHSTSV